MKFEPGDIIRSNDPNDHDGDDLFMVLYRNDTFIDERAEPCSNPRCPGCESGYDYVCIGGARGRRGSLFCAEAFYEKVC
jgi:hypothetical protein